MNRIFTTVIITLLSLSSFAKDSKTIYLFPGQGSDYRIFGNLNLPEDYDTVHINYPVPDKGEVLEEYSLRFLNKIDTTHPFILIGVSMGGMICTELSTLISPQKTIIISSAKCKKELPGRYRFNHYIPINKITPKSVIKRSAMFLQPRVEKDSQSSDVFHCMLSQKDPTYLKRTINMILNWDRKDCPNGIIHIHGTQDHTLPIKNISPTYIINNGTHMMTYTKGAEINNLILQEIKKP